MPHISYIHIHTVTPGYKMKSLTILKQINFTKQTFKSETHQHLIVIGLMLGFRVSLGLIMVTFWKG